MKILYGIQGTGNGHLSRAEEIIPEFSKYADVDVIISGNQSQLKSSFEINYKKSGLTFMASKKGKVDLLSTIFKSHPIDFIRDIKNFPIKHYDLVISDFEPISAWSALIHNVPSIELSHQAAVLHSSSPKPEKKDVISNYILSHYCPSKLKFGFHFEEYDKQIYGPIIRNEIRQLDPIKSNHYTVYLPAYDNKRILSILAHFPVEWHVFSKYTKSEYKENNVVFKPIEKESFTNSLISCEGILCGAGFELPAEALFLGKKLMVIPMSGQFEQECNAESLRRVGVTVLTELSLSFYREFNYWINFEKPIVVKYENQLTKVVEDVLTTFENKQIPEVNFERILLNPQFYRYFL